MYIRQTPPQQSMIERPCLYYLENILSEKRSGLLLRAPVATGRRASQAQAAHAWPSTRPRAGNDEDTTIQSYYSMHSHLCIGP